MQGFSIVKPVALVRFCQSYHITHMQKMEQCLQEWILPMVELYSDDQNRILL